ncbi:hypothetical protein [Emticicia sp. 17c]|uniref:hypothetical protein n=1 Tax=Emticicia sp. 17c TaxID=3127704 RepID=UPI00301C45CE
MTARQPIALPTFLFHEFFVNRRTGINVRIRVSVCCDYLVCLLFFLTLPASYRRGTVRVFSEGNPHGCPKQHRTPPPCQRQTALQAPNNNSSVNPFIYFTAHSRIDLLL